MSHNVVYFSSKANQIPLPGIANLPYTDVIVAFLVPKDGLNLGGAGGAFDHNLQSNIQALQSAGKNVLISFGGSKFPSSAYQSYALDVNGLVGQIVSFVTTHGFNGVDIDYEDDAGFRGTYDGIGFLSALTNGLAQALPAGRTSSPMPHKRPIGIPTGTRIQTELRTPRYGSKWAIRSHG
jgi:hypothetical protein